MSRWNITSVEESLIQNVLKEIHIKGPYQTSMNILADWYEEQGNVLKSEIWRFLARENRFPVTHSNFLWYQENFVVQLGRKHYHGILPDTIFDRLTGHITNDGEYHSNSLPWKTYKKRKQAIEAVVNSYIALKEKDRSVVLQWTAEESHQYHHKKHTNEWNALLQKQLDADPQCGVFPFESRGILNRKDIQTDEFILLGLIYRYTMEGQTGCVENDEFLQEVSGGRINVGDVIQSLIKKKLLEQTTTVIDGKSTRLLVVHW